MLLWMAKQNTLNSKLVIVSVDRGGHFWQWFNLSSTKGHIGQMRVGKSPSPRFQTTSCPICESLRETARWGKWERKNHKLLLYSFAAFCSHHGYVGCKTLPEKDFVSKLQKSTYINMLNSGCIWSLQTKPCYGAFAVRGHAKDLWVVPTQHKRLCAAFDAIIHDHLEICFAPPRTGASCHAFSPV